MAKTHSRRSQRRFQRVSTLSDQERIAEADRIIKELNPETKFETVEEGDGWSIAKAVKQEQELNQIQSEQTLTICEDCLRVAGLLGKPGWKGGIECDICGEREWCNVFYPDETLELGDVYENSLSDNWGEEPPIFSSSVKYIEEGNGLTLECTKCGKHEDPKIHTANETCTRCKTGVLKYPKRTAEKDMLVCNFCGTNWDSAWGIQCAKCGQGSKMVQSITNLQSVSGETECVCDTCGELWTEPEGCTTCSICEYGVIKYQKKLPPDVAPKHLDPRLPDLRRIWTPDYDGPPGADGGAKMVEKRTHDPELDDYDGHLYSTKQDY